MNSEVSAEAEKMNQMVGPAMRMMAEITKDIKAKNVLAEFVEAEVGGLFEGSNEMASGFLVKMQVEEANQNPSFVLKKFLRFYEAFREFYLGLEKSAEADANPPVEEEKEETDDGVAEDTNQVE